MDSTAPPNFQGDRFGWPRGFIPSYKIMADRRSITKALATSCHPISSTAGTMSSCKNATYWFKLATERNLPSQTPHIAANSPYGALATSVVKSSSNSDGGSSDRQVFDASCGAYNVHRGYSPSFGWRRRRLLAPSSHERCRPRRDPAGAKCRSPRTQSTPCCGSLPSKLATRSASSESTAPHSPTRRRSDSS